MTYYLKINNDLRWKMNLKIVTVIRNKIIY